MTHRPSRTHAPSRLSPQNRGAGCLLLRHSPTATPDRSRLCRLDGGEGGCPAAVPPACVARREQDEVPWKHHEAHTSSSRLIDGTRPARRNGSEARRGQTPRSTARSRGSQISCLRQAARAFLQDSRTARQRALRQAAVHPHPRAADQARVRLSAGGHRAQGHAGTRVHANILLAHLYRYQSRHR